jgi:hypothetical protein
MLIFNPLSTFAETQQRKPDVRFTLESFVTKHREDGSWVGAEASISSSGSVDAPDSHPGVWMDHPAGDGG